MEFIDFLMESYSRCRLSVKTDRVVALSGLEDRIARALNCQRRYGIFASYLHRNLLWLRSDKKMERIGYGTQNVPSWSWMAYDGGIWFMDIQFGTVNWINDLRFDNEREHALITDVGEFRDCVMKQEGEDYAILDFGGTNRGWIRYDVERGEDLRKERCVVVGRKYDHGVKKYYMLLVRQKGVDDEYERVGIGWIQSEYVLRQRLNVRVI